MRPTALDLDLALRDGRGSRSRCCRAGRRQLPLRLALLVPVPRQRQPVPLRVPSARSRRPQHPGIPTERRRAAGGCGAWPGGVRGMGGHGRGREAAVALRLCALGLALHALRHRRSGSRRRPRHPHRRLLGCGVLLLRRVLRRHGQTLALAGRVPPQQGEAHAGRLLLLLLLQRLLLQRNLLLQRHAGAQWAHRLPRHAHAHADPRHHTAGQELLLLQQWVRVRQGPSPCKQRHTRGPQRLLLLLPSRCGRSRRYAGAGASRCGGSGSTALGLLLLRRGLCLCLRLHLRRLHHLGLRLRLQVLHHHLLLHHLQMLLLLLLLGKELLLQLLHVLLVLQLLLRLHLRLGVHLRLLLLVLLLQLLHEEELLLLLLLCRLLLRLGRWVLLCLELCRLLLLLLLLQLGLCMLLLLLLQ